MSLFFWNPPTCHWRSNRGKGVIYATDDNFRRHQGSKVSIDLPMDTFSEDFNISAESISLLLLAVGSATGGKVVIDATSDTFQGHYSGKVCIDLPMDDFSENLRISVESVHVTFLL
ncbi:hypothetical protein AVEN_255523-1 [Araneus ventricosus]|uniref:Uncharacterized protein n=1 Tax=Araneus ventricosus TaxID=182803 RepID=A0A4Y2NMT7_ARAVE|nr:hypothetical protein AVEN_255523-1 [Araneus ventricosus]